MIDLTKFSKGLNNVLKKGVTVKLIVTAGLVGMVLILMGQLTDSPGRRAPPPSGQNRAPAVSASQMSAEEYAGMLEQRLEELVSSIQGVGRARVMVTLEHGVEYVFAQEERSGADSMQVSYVLVDTEFGRRQPLVRTQRQPRVQGVIVVCEGADDVRVQQKLINVVTTALNIPTTRVCVVKIDGAN